MTIRLQIFLVILLIKLISTQRISPCPSAFRYEPSEGAEEDRWYGSITLQTSEELSGIWLRVILDRKAELLGNWFGEVNSLDNINFSITNVKYKLEADSPIFVRIFVKYNTAEIVPSIKTIRLNGRTICRENTASTISTTTTPQPINPDFAPPPPSSSSRPAFVGGVGSPTPINRPNLNSNDDNNNNNNNNENDDITVNVGANNNNNNFFQGDFNLNNASNLLTKTTSTGPGSGIGLLKNRNVPCGVVPMRPSPLITYAQSTTKGQWPWHVALYHTGGLNLIYSCGATLINENYVLTAAHCVTIPQTNRPERVTNILLYFGKYSLSKFGNEVQNREVLRIYVHPRYNFSYYYNDIALLKLTQPVEYTNFVRPCCLWEEEESIENLINKQGTVVGWGFNERRELSKDLMQAEMPVVAQLTCIYSNRDFFSQFTSETSYCAGFKNRTSVCNGDSGGGMFFPKRGTSGPNSVWQIRGLVSLSVPLQGYSICDPEHYVVFTDVAKFSDWIKRTIVN